MSRSPTDSLEDLNLLDLVPRQLADWREEGAVIILELPAPQEGWWRPMSMLGYVMSTKKIRLDEVGSFAWRLFDGHRTVAQVAEALALEFGDRVTPAEERLGHLIRMLRHGKMIAYEGIDRQPDSSR